ncbi:helix-turn-helix domain-containing protein [Candidatus Thiodiazotropha sp. CDECU1]|uniref:helix-turn-helix domain-containing protein n=1 Tax=Candidatus Thiodiazotropha sp. CDECU1 TaxID=3065865 RepID=UPI00292EDF52|nr:helix-turn-helix domain-containing protein [Candidatus Thiodiazotropha sp. CDECU1]
MFDLMEISPVFTTKMGRQKNIDGGFGQGLTYKNVCHSGVVLIKNLLQEKQVKDIKFFPMTQAKFAETTGVSLATVRAWVARGHIPTLRVGRRRLVDVAAYLEQIREQGQ